MSGAGSPTGSLLMAPRADDPRLRRPPSFAWRRATAPLRALPDFLIVGAMKAGTSSLFAALRQHPLVAPPYRKECHYFTLGRPAGRSLSWYRAHFPLRARMGRGAITGEATPEYGYEPGVIEDVARLLPGVRLILLVRDPAERAVSHYFHEVRMGRETLPIEAAMAAEEARLAAARAAGPAGRETLAHAAYKARGRYHEQVSRYLRVVPRDRLLVLSFADLEDEPAALLARTERFLGLPPSGGAITVPRRNEGTNRTPVPAAVRDALAAHFAPHDAALADLLGQPVPWRR